MDPVLGRFTSEDLIASKMMMARQLAGTTMEERLHHMAAMKSGQLWNADASPTAFDGGDFNISRYVANSPLNYFDPTGLALEENKLIHLFNKPGHLLGPVLAQTGGNIRAAALAIELAARVQVGALGLAEGVLYKETITVLGYSVVVSGKIVDGIVRVGTAYIPK
jgi:hypothetical protein